ncbi:MAG: TIGR03905 family TSCPD domain-containing protein [Oscillospiraceae bacterium]|nr:TIGR03905 family TSCPD domain-containing protein [Oscillospiraceae bacterium]
MIYQYVPHGICAQRIILDIEDGVIRDVNIVGGCDGNHKGITALVKGMKVAEVKDKLKGIRCGFRDTSCPDQLSRALEEYEAKNK